MTGSVPQPPNTVLTCASFHTLLFWRLACSIDASFVADSEPGAMLPI
jgi:hypothetical protein